MCPIPFSLSGDRKLFGFDPNAAVTQTPALVKYVLATAAAEYAEEREREREREREKERIH